MDQIPVQDHDHWHRDPNTGSLQCSDTNTYKQYMRAYEATQRKKQEFDTLQNEVSGLKSELSDIKSLLLTLVQNNSRKHYDD